MDDIAIDIVYHLSDHLQRYNPDTGQRWPVMLPNAKLDILNFRAVCRGFRNAAWVLFRNVIAEKIFYLTFDDMKALEEISLHDRLAPLITTLTFGGKLFNHEGLEILERQLESHPTHVGESPSWQRSLASRSRYSYRQWVSFKSLYGRELQSQEEYWSSGQATRNLIGSLDRLNNLKQIRVFPRSQRVVLEDGHSEGKLSFRPRRPTHFAPPEAVTHVQCDGWRDVSRILKALSGMRTKCFDLRASSISNVRWSITSSIFRPQLFRNLNVLQISVIEELLIGDEVYQNDQNHSMALSKCLQAAPNLKSLDLEICQAPGIETTFNSFILADISRTPIPYQLEHLVIEYCCTSQSRLTELIKPHASTLKRLILISTWIRPGNWNSWLTDMKEMGVMLNWLEIWKPSHGGTQCYANSDWFKLSQVAAVSSRGKAVPYIGEEDEETGEPVGQFEEWSNCFPRYGRR